MHLFEKRAHFVGCNNNALQFGAANLPSEIKAMTFDNVQIYNSGYRTGDYLPSGDTAGAWTYLGYHEQEHTYQYQVLGPLYPLFYLLGPSDILLGRAFGAR